MQVMKKKKSDAESQHEDYNEFKSDEDKHDSQYKKEEKKLSEESKSKDYNDFECNEGEDARGKKRKKKKLCKESKSKEYNELESNEGEDDARGTKRKKKKLSKESKSKEYNEFERIEGEDDVQGKKRKKKKLSKESKSMEYNTFEKNEGEDDAQGKERKKKKLSKESKSKEYNDESVEGEDDVQGKKRKKKKLSKESKSKEYNEFESIECEDDVQGKKRKKRKLSKESKSKEYNVFEKNEGEDDVQGKKRKKKKLSEESKSKEYNNEFESNEGKDDSPGVEKKKLHNKGKNKENSKFNSKEGDPPLARVTEVDDQSKKMKTKKKAEADNGETPNPAQSGLSKPKRVTFSDKVDVCCDGLIRGKRFTPEEDEKIKLAVFDYIESHGLGDEGLDMVLHCKSHSEVRNCWREIGAAFPERPYVSVYTRAHVLFERDEKRKWTPDEYEFLRKVYEQHGSNWITVAEAMGKHRYHVKDAWRRIKLSNTKKGRWTQEEYQNLFDLVNQDLRVRALQGYRKSRHGMLRDNIGWEAIGDKLATRNGVHCCQKWYSKLASPLVASGAWSDTDDYLLVNALVTLDACCMEEVDWDNLLEHRPGDVCRKRWNQMVQCIGEHGGKSFAEQVEILAKRFCPDLVEVREAFDAKPLVC